MENPYQTNNISPSQANSGIFQQDRQAESLEATGLAQSALYGSKGWVRLISVLGFVYFAIMILIIFFTFTFLGGGGAGLAGLIFLCVLIIAVIVFMLALRLSRFSSAIARAEISLHPADLEDAIIEQMKFWRLTGIMILIGLVMVVLSWISA